MKVYIKESGDTSRVTFDIDKEFNVVITEESFIRLIQDYWQLRKLLLSMNSIKDIDTKTGVLKTKYGTEINCFKMSSYAKLFVLCFFKHVTDAELIIPYSIVRYNLYTDGLLDWLKMCNTSLYFEDSNTAETQIKLLRESILVVEEESL